MVVIDRAHCKLHAITHMPAGQRNAMWRNIQGTDAQTQISGSSLKLTPKRVQQHFNDENLFFFQSFTVFIQHSSCCWLRAISLTINPDWAARKSERAGECWWRATVHPLLLPVSTPCMGTMQKDGGHRQDRSWSVELVRVKELYHQGNPEMCLRWAGEVPFFPNQNPYPAFRLGLILDGKHFSN